MNLESQDPKELPKRIAKAYKLLHSHNFTKVRGLLPTIPGTIFEYHEILFLLTHNVASYDEFHDKVFANSYKESMTSTLESMIELCPNNKKVFFQSLLETYKRELLQRKHDMEVFNSLRELLKKHKFVECGFLLENELSNGPVNLAWCVMMAKIKLKINPSYNCKQEYMYFKKHFTKKEHEKFRSGYYHPFSCEGSCIYTMLESWDIYSKRYSSLLLFPYNLICGTLLGVKMMLIGIGFMPIIIFIAGIYHIFQLITLSRRKLFIRVLRKEKPILFAQLYWYEKIKYEMENYWEFNIPFLY